MAEEEFGTMIKEGFNISTFSKYGQFDEYICYKRDLSELLIQLHKIINLTPNLNFLRQIYAVPFLNLT